MGDSSTRMMNSLLAGMSLSTSILSRLSMCGASIWCSLDTCSSLEISEKLFKKFSKSLHKKITLRFTKHRMMANLLEFSRFQEIEKTEKLLQVVLQRSPCQEEFVMQFILSEAAEKLQRSL